MFAPQENGQKFSGRLSRLAKYRKLGGSELQKCTVNRKGISFTRRQQPMNRITLPPRTTRGRAARSRVTSSRHFGNGKRRRRRRPSMRLRLLAHHFRTGNRVYEGLFR